MDLSATYEAWRRLPDDPAAAVWITLNRIAELARSPSSDLTRFALGIARSTRSPSELDQAQTIFDWTRQHIRYRHDPPGIEDIQTPDRLLYLILTEGGAEGDCDDFVGFLGAMYHTLGFPQVIETVSLNVDQEWEHVYLRVEVDGEWVAADAIVDEPFGWEIPDEEVTSRIEMPV